jgi:hypothetical protein
MSTLQSYADTLPEGRTRSYGALLYAWFVPVGVAALWVLLIWSIHRESPRTLISFHGLLHAAIVEELASPGRTSIPPENPFYAGQPVAYYWFFHLLAAQVVRLFSMNVFHAMEALILLATATLMVAAVALGRRIFNSTLAGVLMGYLIMAGANPLGALFALYTIARNGVHVLDDNPNYLWGVVHPLYSLIRYNDFGGLYGPLLNFYLNITSRPVALSALLVAALCFYWVLHSRRPASFISLGLAFALTTALSPIVGVTAGGALGAAMVGVWLKYRGVSSDRTARIKGTTVVASCLAIVAGIVIASPTYYHLILGPSSDQPRFALLSASGLKHVLTATMSILPLAVMALLGLRRAPKDGRQFLVMIFLAALALLALDVGVSLPLDNNSNMFHAAAVLLVIPAAGVILRRKPGQGDYEHSTRRTAVIALFFLPTTLALVAAYIDRPPLPVSFESVSPKRLPGDSDLALLYDWARNDTDPRAVFVIDPRHRVALCGNTAEFPAMTGRAIFTEHHKHYLSEPYPDSKLRFDLAVRLVMGEEPDANDRAYLQSLNRPIFIVDYAQEEGSFAYRMKDLYGSPAFQHGSVSVYRIPNS